MLAQTKSTCINKSDKLAFVFSFLLYSLSLFHAVVRACHAVNDLSPLSMPVNVVLLMMYSSWKVYSTVITVSIFDQMVQYKAL